MTNYWVVRAGRRGDNIEDVVQTRGLIGIGWAGVGNLRKFKRDDMESLKRKVHEADPDERAGLGARILHRFGHEIEEGDIVLTPIKSTRTILIGRVTGDYLFNAQPEHYLLTNTRAVDWLRTDVSYDESPIPLNGQLAVWDANGYADDIELLIPEERSSDGHYTREQPRAPTARKVTADTIALRVLPAEWASQEQPDTETDLRAWRDAIASRTSHHNQLVQAFARISSANTELSEGVFDLAALTPSGVLLAEMKTLDGTLEDERRQVRYAVGQLLYYEGLCLPDEFADKPLAKAAVFDKQPSPEHTRWMEGLKIAVVWQDDDGRFTSTPESNQLIESVGLPPFTTEESA